MTRKLATCLVLATFCLYIVYIFIRAPNLWMKNSIWKNLHFERNSSNASHTYLKNPNPPLIIYNRVDKCGSRSLIEITKRLAEMKGYSYHQRQYQKGVYRLSERGIKREKLFISSLSRPGVYAPHLYYLNFQEDNLDFPIVYINIIRDPADRFVSAYNFKLFGDSRVVRRNHSDPMDINKCLIVKEHTCTPIFHMGRFFCGHSKNCSVMSQSLHVTKRNIEKSYILVGLTEEFNSTLQLLEKILPDYFEGATAVWETIQRNVTKETKSKKRFTLTESSRRILKTRLVRDYALYDWVKKRFYEQKRQYGIR